MLTKAFVGIASRKSVAKLALRQTQIRNFVAPLKDINFLVKDVMKVKDHYSALGYDAETLGEEMFDMIMGESAKFCENVLAPLQSVGDDVGCIQKDAHTVITPPGYKDAYDQYIAGGWQGLPYPAEYGGQNLPQSLALFTSEMAATACFPWTMYPGLSKGAINTLYAHGSEKLKEKYLHRMISGEWTGTMCLTEPQCGSDLNQVAPVPMALTLTTPISTCCFNLMFFCRYPHVRSP